MSLLDILELRKDISAIVHQPESILCKLISHFFESVPYFSPQGPVTTSESISLSPSVPLPAPAIVHDVSSPMSLKDTEVPPAPKPPRKKDFRHVYTHRQKFLPLNRFRPPHLQWKVYLLSHSTFL